MTHHCTQQSSDPRRMYNHWKWVGTVFLLAALFTPGAASAAAWESKTIATHPTWIYTPDGKLQDSAKRGLMVVLHGCLQTNEQVKNGGHLEGVAEQFGLVVAVPYVTKADGYLRECWNYNYQTDDKSGHLAEIIALTRDLTKDGAIDPKHVYVVGLSSGGALALKLGCKAPDLYAGIGAIAGPSVGSDQYNALVDKSSIPRTNVENAIKVCKSLAGGNAASLATQIANIAYGDMDRNGPRQIIETPECQQVHPGQNCVASIKWSEDNVKILQGIYGAGPLGPPTAVQDGKATEQNAKAKADDKIAPLGLLVMHNVGHAFAAGSGQPNNTVNGQYIAQQGPNHFKYVAQWLTEHNRRGTTRPVVTCDDPKVAGDAVTLDCSASGPHPITSYHVVLKGPSARDETLPREASLSKKYDGLAAGSYQAVVSATDEKGLESPKITSRQFQIPAAAAPSCITADNKTHIAKSRAHACWWSYCANGSEDSLGYWSSTITSLQMKPDKPDYWTRVNGCPVQ